MKNNAPAGVYIHVPFCVTRCPYCDFFSGTDRSAVPEWSRAVQLEIRRRAVKFPEVDTIFFGGGTPSCVPSGTVAEILHTIRSVMYVAPNTEITLEANPDDVTPEWINALVTAGITRISLGIQSLRDPELRFLGRRHDAAAARRAVEVCRTAGVDNLGMDLITGLPDQTVDHVLESLIQVIELAPEHISCYQLTVSPGTRLHRDTEAGRVRMPMEKHQAAVFLGVAERLTSAGYFHYEVSNFARTPAHECRHNMKYWTHGPYLGVGPSAHSFRPWERWWNLSNTAEYCARLNGGVSVEAGREDLDEDQVFLERLSLGFRTARGVALDVLSRCPAWESRLERLVHAEYLAVRDDRAVPTTTGYLVADRLPLEFAP